MVPSHSATTHARVERDLVPSVTAQEDAVLVSRFKAGDEAAFDEITLRYRDKLAAFSFTVLRSHADAEEIAQDTLISAHRNLPEFRGDCSLTGWLHTIALNRSRNRYWHLFRRRRHLTQSLDTALSEDNPATIADVAACDAPGPVSEVITREFCTVVAACIAKLAPAHREILDRRILQSCSYEQIADGLGISVGTVKSRIARAREKLRAVLGHACPEIMPDAALHEWFDPVRASGWLRRA